MRRKTPVDLQGRFAHKPPSFSHRRFSPLCNPCRESPFCCFTVCNPSKSDLTPHLRPAALPSFIVACCSPAHFTGCKAALWPVQGVNTHTPGAFSVSAAPNIHRFYSGVLSLPLSVFSFFGDPAAEVLYLCRLGSPCRWFPDRRAAFQFSRIGLP